MELEQRVTRLEQIVQGIAALPQLSVIAMKESKKKIEFLKEKIECKKKELKIETIPPTRRYLAEDIEKFEYLISPAICTDFLYSNQQDSSTENSSAPQPSSKQLSTPKPLSKIDTKDIVALLKEPTIRAEIRKIAAEEANYRAWKYMKTTYPPELWQALQKAFPALLSDLPEERKPSHRPAESLSNP